MDTPALWFTAIIFLLVFVGMAIVSEVFEEEDINSIPVVLEFPRYEPNQDFLEWWTPDILDHYAEIEKMTTLPGSHLVGTIDNLITPIVPQWYSNKQDSI